MSNVSVQPSVRRKELGLALDIGGNLPAGTVEITAHLLDESGREEKQFTARAPCIAADRQVVTFRLPWRDPRLWDVDKPNLYTLALTVRAGGLQEEVRRQFGFREFWVEGKRFYLNGIPIRLRPVAGLDIEAQRRAGFNCTVLRPDDPDEGGVLAPDRAWFDKADESGWLTTAALPSMAPYLSSDRNAAWTPTKRDAWEQRVSGAIRALQNHPSIVMWDHSPGLFGSSQDLNPKRIGRIDRTDRASPTGRVQAGLEGCAIVRRLDPTRPVFAYGGGDVGDVFAVEHFLDMIPLQEREDWMTDWASSGDMPYMGVAFGTPYLASFMRGRGSVRRALTSEPLVTEFGAIYLGRQAYVEETLEYRAAYKSRFQGGQEYRFDSDADGDPIRSAAAFQHIETLFNRNTWRSWRTTGVTGGMAPFGLQVSGDTIQTESERALYANNGPTLAWITGPGDAPTAKTHEYHVDEVVEKQVALLNDTLRTQTYTYSWSAQINRKTVASASGHGTIYPAQTLFRPLRFPTPFFSNGRAEGVITLAANIAGQVHEDRFEFGILARRGRRDRPPSLPVFDPGGKTADILPVGDFVPRAWHGERNVPLVILGQNALSSGHRIPGDLEAYVRGGGRALIFSQNPDWIEKSLGLHTAAVMARRAYPVTEGHPIMRGLKVEDLRDWRGLSAMLPNKLRYAGSTPEFGWHWGNRGVVSSVSIEKPHMSSWRPLLETEFDLAYSPLMEMDYGRGRVVWCTLDLEDHAPTDAAAERMFARVLDYALHAPLAPKADRVVYVGDKPGAERLNHLGAQFTDTGKLRADAGLLAGPEAPQLLIVGGNAEVTADDLALFLWRGGHALFLRREPGAPGIGPALGVAVRHGSLDVPVWAQCRGVGVSDMHWRADLDVPVIQSLPAIEAGGLRSVGTIGADGLLGRITLGRGSAVFCQIAPESLDADTKTYLRLTRWRQTHTLCLLLSNMGASFRQDARIFHPDAAGEPLPGFYYPDYRADFELGDNPYRFSQW